MATRGRTITNVCQQCHTPKFEIFVANLGIKSQI
nr:MAG TPA: cytochrome c-553 [Caudoviricetes sp.]